MEKEKLNYYKIIIGAYLHDCGKLLWRGGFERLSNKQPYIQVAHSQHLRDILLFSKEYFDFNQIKHGGSKYFENSDNFWYDIAYIGALHHGKDKKNLYNSVFKENKDTNKALVNIVYLADNIASLDRIKKENDDEISENENIKTIGLGNIFENIFTGELKLKNNNFFAKTSLENIELPQENDTSNFNKLAKDFYNDLMDLLIINEQVYEKSETELKKFIYDLDLLCQRYFTLVPSDSFQGETQDLSLYDHSKIVVAVSSILFKQWENGGFEKKLSTKTSEVQKESISLLAGDFPSIQSYIFDGITKSKNLAKRLRARSFIVQILNEAVIEFLLDKLKLPRANILINAGGKFVILSYCLTDEIVKNLKNDINEFLLKKYNGNLKFSLIWQKKQIGNVFASKNLNGNGDNGFDMLGIKNTFVELFDELSLDKFKTYNNENFANLFKNESVSGKQFCKYCSQNYLFIENDENDEDLKCENCKKEIEIGENLPKCEYISLNYKDKRGKFDFDIGEKGEIKISFNNWDFRAGFDKQKDKTIEEFIKNRKITIGKSINLYTPKNNENETKDFGDIIKDDKGIKGQDGLDFLCMLKGDVDAMSLIFKHGFDYNPFNKEIKVKKVKEKEKFTQKLSGFTNLNSLNINYDNSDVDNEIIENVTIKKTFYSVNRLVQFSRFLELFFGTYLNKEIGKKFKNVYTVFSGGDDFVFIVPFSQREEFITYLNESFEKWVALNPNLHFSVGLGLFKDKTPFHQMDRKTESLLNSAKLKTKELNRMEISLKNKGICIFEPDFMVLGNQIDFKFGIKKWKDGSEFVIGDTQIHNIYSELRKIQEVLEGGGKDYAKLVLIGARIINMLGRNKKEVKEKQEFQDLQQDIRDFIQKVDLNEQSKKEKQDKINKVLLGIVDEIYEKRYRSNC